MIVIYTKQCTKGIEKNTSWFIVWLKKQSNLLEVLSGRIYVYKQWTIFVSSNKL